MDAAERDLDLRQIARCGEGRRRLECGDGGWVLAEAGAELADPLVDARGGRRVERKRGVQVVDRLGVGEDALGSVGCLEVGRDRRLAAGPLPARGRR